MSRDVEEPRPTLVISRCLGFAPCRWNGDVVGSPLVQAIASHARVLTPCPETDLGLGIPREPIRVVEQAGEILLQQNATERDITVEMRAHLDALVASFPPVDGFILKAKSPTCGLVGIKVYPRLGPCSVLRSNGRGFFGGLVALRFPTLPALDEGQLKNSRLRDTFLAATFTLARFRAARDRGGMAALVAFHAEHKYLLQVRSTPGRELLGKLVANHEGLEPARVWDDYEAHLRVVLARPPRTGAHVAVLQRVAGRYSKRVGDGERRELTETIAAFGERRLPLAVPLMLLESLAARFEDDYAAASRYFAPYPRPLLELTESGTVIDH